MKNLFLLSSLLLGASALDADAQEVMFDFYNTADLGQFTYTPLTIDELQKATFTNESNGKETTRLQFTSPNYLLIMNDETITKEGVGITVTNPEKIVNYPRYFFGSIKKTEVAAPTATDFYCDLRWYKTNELTVTAPDGKKIEKIVMDATCGDYPVRANGDTFVMDEVGKQTINDAKTLNTWESDGQTVTSVTFKAASGAPTQMAYSIAVTLSDLNGGSGISSIGSDDSNAPVEYYDLTGVRCNPYNLTPGIYVMRKGASVKKVSIK